MKALLLSILLFSTFSTANATTETVINLQLLNQLNKDPWISTPILVKQGTILIGTNTTDKTGKCALHINPGSGNPNDKSTWLYFYAIRSVGDTVLLKSFYNFPNSFKQTKEQVYSTTFYLNARN